MPVRSTNVVRGAPSPRIDGARRVGGGADQELRPYGPVSGVTSPELVDRALAYSTVSSTSVSPDRTGSSRLIGTRLPFILM